MSMIHNNEQKHDDDDCWPFFSQSNSAAKTEIARHGKWGNFYSIDMLALPTEQQQTDHTATELRPGEAKTERQSPSLGKLFVSAVVNNDDNNNDEPHNKSNTSPRNNTNKVLCWYRFKVWWIRPMVIDYSTSTRNDKKGQIIPPETIALLFQDAADGRYRFILPSSSCSLRSTIHSNDSDVDDDDGSIILVSSEPTSTRASSSSCYLYCGVGTDPHALIREGLLGINITNVPYAGGSRSSSRASSMPTRQRQSRRTTSFLNGLGWCSWNAFYTQISGSKLVQAVQRLRQYNGNGNDNGTTTRTATCNTTKIPMRWIIIDDGWQRTTNDNAENGQQWSERLAGWKESASKFNIPNNDDNNNSSDRQLSLKDAITKIKQAGVEDVWVWHTLMGYWLGLDPKAFPDSKLYYPHFSKGIMQNDKSATNEASVQRGIGIPDNPNEFFDKYHGYLQSCGVSGVKVDAQGVVGSLRRHSHGHTGQNADLRRGENDDNDDSNLVLRIHKGLANSVYKHFIQPNSRDNEPPACGASDRNDDTADVAPPSIIHCMAHSPKIFHNLPAVYPSTIRRSRPLFRASDDHYPDNANSHGSHIVACAYNSILFSHVSIPDWDMFTTQMDDERTVKLHAVARCLSGGPIYLSDPPNYKDDEDSGKNNCISDKVIDWICCKDGTTLPCRETALPIAPCLLMDPLAIDSKPLIIFNINGPPSAGAEDDSSVITSGVFGVFHLAGSGRWNHDALDYIPEPVGASSLLHPQAQSVSLRPMDIPSLCVSPSSASSLRSCRKKKFLAMPFFNSQQTSILESPSDELILELEPLECDAIAILPILEGKNNGADGDRPWRYEIAALGFAGKINGAGAVLDSRVQDRDNGTGALVQLEVQGCGTFLVAVCDTTSCRGSPPTTTATPSLQANARVNGAPVSHTIWHANSYREHQGQKQQSKIPEGVLKEGFDIIAFEVETCSVGEQHQDTDRSIILELS